jgi:hypothetical protein
MAQQFSAAVEFDRAHAGVEKGVLIVDIAPLATGARSIDTAPLNAAVFATPARN